MSDKMAADYSVLIVDDVPTNVMLVQAILKKEGYTLLTANSGKKALEMTDVHNPNLILLDIMMPNLDGYSTLDLLKKEEKPQRGRGLLMDRVSELEALVLKAIEKYWNKEN